MKKFLMIAVLAGTTLLATTAGAWGCMPWDWFDNDNWGYPGYGYGGYPGYGYGAPGYGYGAPGYAAPGYGYGAPGYGYGAPGYGYGGYPHSVPVVPPFVAPATPAIQTK